MKPRKDRKIAGVVLIISLLFACAPEPAESNPSKLIEFVGKKPRPWVDPQTGCEYLVMYDYEHGSAITPRLDTYGEPYCGHSSEVSE